MHVSTIVVDSQVKGDWDADIFQDESGYFGVLISYPTQIPFILNFVRISNVKFNQIVSELESLDSTLSIGKYLANQFEQIDEKNRDNALRFLNSRINFTNMEKDELTFWDASVKFSKLSKAAYKCASEELERGNIYRYITLSEISKRYWENALDELDCANASGEFRNRRPEASNQNSAGQN